MSNIILETRELEKIYTIDQKPIQILQPTSLQIASGEFVVFSGSSGSGKTTLLTLLSGLDRPTAGEVILDSENITHLSEDELAPVRNRKTGFVFQAFYLVPSLTALENVSFPAELKGDREATRKAEELMHRVGVWKRKNSYPSQLSGGEKQRVAICRALINQPSIVFADEPTGNLDSTNSNQVLELLLDLHREMNTTLVMATHSKVVSESADRNYYLHDGIVSAVEEN